jgi:hypothetical protein
MRAAWEREVIFNRRRAAENAWTPWAEARKWRRRFWWSAAIVAYLLLRLSLAGSCR